MSDAGRAGRAQRNREIDAIDLVASLDVLPAPADPSFSPLAHVGRPTEPEGGPSAPPAGRGRTTVGPRVAGQTSPGRVEGRGEGSPVSRRRRRAEEPEVEAVRSQRDEKRSRLVREALLERGLDPDDFNKKPLPRGGKHRPTIELSPEEYAEIQIATAVRSDVFGPALVSFIRTCAAHWEAIADRLSDPAANA